VFNALNRLNKRVSKYQLVGVWYATGSEVYW